MTRLLKEMTARIKYGDEPYPITSLKEYEIDEMEQSKIENGIGSCIDGSFNGCHINGKWALSPEPQHGSGVVDPDTRNQKDGSVHFRSKQLLLRQEACALPDKAFNFYTLPLASK